MPLQTTTYRFLNVNGGAQVARQPDTCQPLVDAINEAGGMATLVNLPDVGIFGNSHQMMSEKNSDEIAEVLVDWIEGNVD